MPNDQRFSLPARFDHQDEKDWLNDGWSLVIKVTEASDAQAYQTGEANFLLPDAPHMWLSEGKKFTLMEGSRSVAIGEVEKVTSP
ncbi:hypothetical protein CP49_19045 [Bradyrhizobium valentinum]|uniref:Uncharacterized protein n=1 Tax=Bradyrhizobium valentinum TaxID=1518501 RepID=A0A0R3LHB8_9BRAD|nr:hypothetical protein CP49_19045 [Bradyrhizobium valentinum]